MRTSETLGTSDSVIHPFTKSTAQVFLLAMKLNEGINISIRLHTPNTKEKIRLQPMKYSFLIGRELTLF